MYQTNESQAVQTPSTVDEVRDSLEYTRRGEVKSSIHNCMNAISYDPGLRGRFRLNLLTDRISVGEGLPWERTSPTMNDTEMYYLLWYLEQQYGLTCEKKIRYALQLIAEINSYHPIRDFLESLHWDGTERIRYALHHFLGCDVSDYNYEALKLFMIGAIRRVYHPGCKFEHMLCLVGGQGAGKSTFFRFLAFADDWFSDDLRKLDDENIYRKLQGHWIIEMSEMIATASAKSIEEIKSFLSRQKETYKVPYEVYPEDRPRQCVFGGTTNRKDFLPRDRTGNRRFIPVTVHPERAEVHILENEFQSRNYIYNMWAEAMEMYRKEDYKLTFSPELDGSLTGNQQEFMQEDPLAGQIYAFLEDYEGDKVCSKLLYAEALGNTFSQPAAWETREICEIMNTAIENGTLPGWQAHKDVRRYGKYGHQRGWERIKAEEPVNAFVNKSAEDFTELMQDEIELPFD